MPDVIAWPLALLLLVAVLVLIFDVIPYMIRAAFTRFVSDPIWHWRSKRRQARAER